MANISNWDEFVQALTTGTDGTLTLTQDIICPETGIENTLTIRSRSTTINGNGYTIWNLSGTANPLISGFGNRAVTWNNVNFNNIYVSSGRVFNGDDDSMWAMTFNSCTFQGQGGVLSGNYNNFNKCAITWKNITPTQASFGRCYMYNCWIHLDMKRSVSDSTPEFGNLDSTYLEGSIGGTSITNMVLTSSMNNCCINITSDIPMTDIVSTAPTVVCVVNKTLLPNYKGSKSNVVTVTDTQMKDASYLASVGFSIIDI